MVDDVVVATSSSPEKIAIGKLSFFLFAFTGCCNFDLNSLSVHGTIIFIIRLIFNHIAELPFIFID